ncbi:MAG TPA: bifunctional adenosylcobinamide kinase/adenosylcobinamide-phosphate guanylyltransferase [Nitrospiraceae bacterium]|nr:bifunctional adenosylcobinamide kinase/adenosylcobinamide-phosphate guanylyltransferase [Nitrospiraceae bacterium]
MPRLRSGASGRRRGRLILVIGGASSGKSRVALELAGTEEKRAFVATGQALDDEMAERISRHRATRDAGWDTAEVPIELIAWFEDKGANYRTIVLDCVTLWLANLQGRGVSNRDVPPRVSALVQAIRRTAARVVVVTNELGLGLVPADARSRRFREMAGQTNQHLACEADEVYMVLSGLPVRLKPSESFRPTGVSR